MSRQYVRSWGLSMCNNANIKTPLKNLSQAEIKAHFSSVDLFELYNNNLLCRLYSQHAFDYALYKALSIITSFKLNIHDKRYSITIPNKCRYLNLKRQFCFWYKRSNTKITLYSLFKSLTRRFTPL